MTHHLDPQPVIACVDVHYVDPRATAACVVFTGWSASGADIERVETIEDVAPYVSGYFYRRELPCIVPILLKLSPQPDLIVIDGYVWLGDERRPGLGGHLYDALDRTIPVIGVAKNPHGRGAPAVPVLRGTSRKPLHVSAVGLPLADAAAQVRSMHGEHRIPTLLARVDRLCRDASSEASANAEPSETPPGEV